jgi:L-2-aminoadipate reductase
MTRSKIGEIDTHLSQRPKVRENVTLVRRDKFEEPTLVVPLQDAFVDSDGTNSPLDMGALIKDVSEYLKLKLPGYTIKLESESKETELRGSE